MCGVALVEAIATDPDAAGALAAGRESEQTAAERRDAAERAVVECETKLGLAQARCQECLEQLTAALNGHADLAALSDAAAEAGDLRDGCVAAHDELDRTRAGLVATRDTTRDAVNAARLAVTEQETTLDGLTRSIVGIRERRETAAAVLRDRFGDAVPEDATEHLAVDRGHVLEATQAVTVARAARDSVTERYQEASSRAADSARRLTAIDLQLTTILANCEAVAAQVAVRQAVRTSAPAPAGWQPIGIVRAHQNLVRHRQQRPIRDHCRRGPRPRPSR